MLIYIKKIYKKILSLYIRLYVSIEISKIFDTSENTISLIVFSKDRPLQLDGFLKSCEYCFQGDKTIFVIFNFSNKSYEHAYKEVFNCHKSVIPIDESSFGNFKNALEHTISMLVTKRLFFFVDDIIFTNTFLVDDFNAINLKKNIVSLRLGENLNYSYVVQKPMSLPEFKRSGKFLIWEWHKANLDWGYPLSLDGNLFLTEEVKILLKYIQFHSPNSLENELQIFKNIYFKRSGCCFLKSRLFNNPCNKIQNEFDNLHGSFHQDDLLDYWNNGKRLNTIQYFNYNNSSVHEEVNIELI